MIKWLIVPENGALLAWIGFALGLLGAIFGAWGIIVALRQLSAIKTETEASSAAIKSVQLKVASFDTVQECHAARAKISDIQKSVQAKKWDAVVPAYEGLIDSFLRLAHSNTHIDDADRALLTKHTKDMATFCEVLRKKLASAEAPVVLKGQDRALRDFSDIMTKITFAVLKDLQK